ncbi:MAG TPA: hypothetical protein VJH03_24615 [Blastocatellia bacterium]|nr:hypothetical protein [Blastocatellia bacterium]
MAAEHGPYSRYPSYHTSEDTPDKIDYDRMARIVSGILSVVVDLAAAAGD